MLLLGAAPTLAHEGEGAGIAVEPSSVTAGDTVVFAGNGLEPDSERVLALAGPDLVVVLGTVTTDAEGMFALELTIPRYLRSGTYELRAIGDEILTTPLAITASAAPGASPALDDTSEIIVSHQRSPLELGLLLGFVIVAFAGGGFLVWRAERFGGTPHG